MKAEANLTGTVYTWNLFGKSRSYSSVTLRYEEAVQFFQAVPYRASTGKGEQRALVESHVKKLKKEMEAGNYTPTCVAVSLTNSHKPSCHDGIFEIAVDSDDPLHLSDGGHRFEAIERILKELWEKPQDEETKALVGQVNSLPITAMVYLDGDSQKDFLNLQAGLNVDSAHLSTMKAKKCPKNLEEALSHSIAVRLNKNEDSPFKGFIRLDSHKPKTLSKRLPVSSLCPRGKSDYATGLTGLACVDPAIGDMRLATCVIMAFKALKEKAPELIDEGMVLCPPPHGIKGSATLLCGLGTVLAYRMKHIKHDIASPDDLERLAAAAKLTLNHEVNGNMAGPAKRLLIGGFAIEFLKDLDGPKHCGLPIPLLKLISPSAFGVEKLPKEEKVKTKPKKGKTPASVVEAPVAPLPAQAELFESKADEQVVIKGDNLEEFGNKPEEAEEGKAITRLANTLDSLVAKSNRATDTEPEYEPVPEGQDPFDHDPAEEPWDGEEKAEWENAEEFQA